MFNTSLNQCLFSGVPNQHIIQVVEIFLLQIFVLNGFFFTDIRKILHTPHKQNPNLSNFFMGWTIKQ